MTESLYECGYCRQEFREPAVSPAHVTLCSVYKLSSFYSINREIFGEDSEAKMENLSFCATTDAKTNLVVFLFLF